MAAHFGSLDLGKVLVADTLYIEGLVSTTKAISYVLFHQWCLVFFWLRYACGLVTYDQFLFRATPC